MTYINPNKIDHEAYRQMAYELQRNAYPSELVRGIAWQHFGSSNIKLANPNDPKERHLIDTVVDVCKARKIRKFPEICIIDSPILNAASVNGEAIVYTTGIMNAMNDQEIAAVTGHELSHHRHHWRDVVAQGAIAMSGAWLAHRAWLLGTSQLATSGIQGVMRMAMESGYSIRAPEYLGAVLPLMPYRHFMELEADKEGAHSTSPAQMKSALQTLEEGSRKLHEQHKDHDPSITHRIVKTLLFPFSTHPPTEKRIAKLDAMEQRMQRQGGFAQRIEDEMANEKTALSR